MKIYINNNVLILTDKLSDTKIIKYQDFNQLKQIISDLENNKLTEIKLYSDNINNIFADLLKIYIKIDAAGGIVRNNKKEILIIERLGKYDLPKGKIEANEDKKETAVREVKEETGLANVELLNSFESTYHTYKINNKKILKQTYWFLMKAPFNQQFTPQTIENITSAEWKKLSELNNIFKNTYPSIKELLSNYFRYVTIKRL